MGLNNNGEDRKQAENQGKYKPCMCLKNNQEDTQQTENHGTSQENFQNLSRILPNSTKKNYQIYSEEY